MGGRRRGMSGWRISLGRMLGVGRIRIWRISDSGQALDWRISDVGNGSAAGDRRKISTVLI
jgi:hypothetical protein